MEHLYNHRKVAVLDRHALFRRGVVGLIREARPTWAASDSDSLDALRADLTTAAPTVVLVDVAHPEVTGFGGLAALVEAYPEHMFVGLSDDDDSAAVLDCLTTGARGYILRATQTTQFVRALETIMDGGVYAPVVLTASARRVETASLGSQGVPALTERQRDVLDLLREGCPTKTIARRLDLAVGTVKIHLAGIYRALGASSRLEAVAKAQRIYA
jgi:DNA-binding NarL/FixJ family response regulator